MVACFNNHTVPPGEDYASKKSTMVAKLHAEHTQRVDLQAEQAASRSDVNINGVGEAG